MLDFFKDILGKKEQKEKGIDQGILKQHTNEPTIRFNLSLKPQEEISMSELQKEYIKEELESLPPINEGDVSVSGIYLYDLGEQLETKLYIRNAMDRPVSFEYIPLVILNSKGDILAYEVFNLEDLGEIPPYSARPYKVFFDKYSLIVDKIEEKDWSIAFDTNIKAVRYIETSYENLPEDLEEQDKEILIEFLKQLPRIEEGDFSISTFNVAFVEENTMLLTTVFRNGYSQPVNLDKLPIMVRDNKGTEVCSGVFEIENFVVNPHRAKLQSFMLATKIPASNYEKDESFTVEHI